MSYQSLLHRGYRTQRMEAMSTPKIVPSVWVSSVWIGGVSQNNEHPHNSSATLSLNCNRYLGISSHVALPTGPPKVPATQSGEGYWDGLEVCCLKIKDLFGVDQQIDQSDMWLICCATSLWYCRTHRAEAGATCVSTAQTIRLFNQLCPKCWDR